MKKFPHLDVPYQWEDYWTKYPHGYTIFEALSNWVTQVDLMVDNINDWNKYLTDFVNQFDINLQNEVEQTLKDWQKSGFLDRVISEALDTGLKNKVDKTNIPVNLKDYGAKGDGLTDDTGAFIQAFKDNPSGATFYLPEGNYGITSSLNIPPYSTLMGESENTRIFFLSTGTNNSITPIIMGESSTIKNLLLDGMVKERVSTGELKRPCAGVQIKNKSNCVVENIVLKNFGFRLPSEVGPEWDTINNNGQGITIELSNDAQSHSERNIIRNCKVLDPEGRLSFGVRIWSTWLNGGRGWIDYYNRYNIVEDVFIYGTCKNALEVVGVNTIHNIIRQVEVYECRGYGGIEADYGASFNRFENNVFSGYNPRTDNNYQLSVFRNSSNILDTRTFPEGNVWVNNTIYGVDSGDRKVKGMYVLNSLDVVVKNLTIHSIKSADIAQGIAVENSKSTTIDSCYIEGVDQGVSYVSGRVEMLSISNSIFKNVEYGYRCYGDLGHIDHLTINNTVVDGCIYGFYLLNENKANISVNTVKGFQERAVLFPKQPIFISVDGNFFEGSGEDKRAVNVNNHNALVTNNSLVNCDINIVSNKRSTVYNNQQKDGYFGSKNITYDIEPPVAGEWVEGDIVYNRKPVSGGYIGWVCVESGSPGVWKEFGLIEL